MRKIYLDEAVMLRSPGLNAMARRNKEVWRVETSKDRQEAITQRTITRELAKDVRLLSQKNLGWLNKANAKRMDNERVRILNMKRAADAGANPNNQKAPEISSGTIVSLAASQEIDEILGAFILQEEEENKAQDNNNVPEKPHINNLGFKPEGTVVQFAKKSSPVPESIKRSYENLNAVVFKNTFLNGYFGKAIEYLVFNKTEGIPEEIIKVCDFLMKSDTGRDIVKQIKGFRTAKEFKGEEAFKVLNIFKTYFKEAQKQLHMND